MKENTVVASDACSGMGISEGSHFCEFVGDLERGLLSRQLLFE